MQSAIKSPSSAMSRLTRSTRYQFRPKFSEIQRAFPIHSSLEEVGHSRSSNRTFLVPRLGNNSPANRIVHSFTLSFNRDIDLEMILVPTKLIKLSPPSLSSSRIRCEVEPVDNGESLRLFSTQIHRSSEEFTWRFFCSLSYFRYHFNKQYTEFFHVRRSDRAR